jgi:transposase
MISIGIDIAKYKIDVHYEGKNYTIKNTSRALKEFFRSLPKDSQVVMEATGKYHRLSHKLLEEMGIKVMLINPFQSRNYAKALNVICKTDRVDAKILSSFGRQLEFKHTPHMKESELAMQELSRCLDDLQKTKISLEARLDAADPFIAKTIKRIIKSIEQELHKLNLKLEEVAVNNKEMQEKLTILLTIPGIGKQTALMLLSNLRELGKIDKNQIVALAGLAPRNNESGTYQGRRYVRGGRVAVRSKMFMPVLGAATKNNKKLNKFYQRLLENGKCKKVALTACMRKMIIWANFLLAKNQSWME